MATKDFAGKATLITGAASGIGRATARAAATKGAALILTDIDAGRLETTAQEITAAGGIVTYSEALDLVDFDAVTSFAKTVQDRVGSVDIVMNIAGISTWGRIQDLKHEHWRRTVEIDLMGPIAIMEAFVPPMIEAGRGGHIVNVSSAAGLFGLPLHAPYSAAKFGLRGVSEVLRFDLERYGIDVTLVCPGAVNTPLVGTVNIVGIDRDDPRVKRFIGNFQKRSVTPEQAANSIVNGVERNKYLVFTSRDTLIGHLMQRFAPWAYRAAMRKLNGRVQGLIERL